MIYSDVVLDAQNLLHRFGWPFKDLSTKLGRPSGFEYGFARMVASLPDLYGQAHYWFCWDGYPERAKRLASEAGLSYKVNRKAKEDDWPEREKTIREFSRNFGDFVFHPQLEADEAMALICKELTGRKVLMVTGDQDMHQLVSDDVHVVTKPGEEIKTKTHIESEWGVPIDKLVWLRALIGDGSDDLSGCTLPKKVLAYLVNMADSPEMLEVFFRNDDLTPHQRTTLTNYSKTFGVYLRIMSLSDLEDHSITLEKNLYDHNNVMAFCTKFEIQSISASVWHKWAFRLAG